MILSCIEQVLSSRVCGNLFRTFRQYVTEPATWFAITTKLEMLLNQFGCVMLFTTFLQVPIAEPHRAFGRFKPLPRWWSATHCRSCVGLGIGPIPLPVGRCYDWGCCRSAYAVDRLRVHVCLYLKLKECLQKGTTFFNEYEDFKNSIIEKTGLKDKSLFKPLRWKWCTVVDNGPDDFRYFYPLIKIIRRNYKMIDVLVTSILTIVFKYYFCINGL